MGVFIQAGKEIPRLSLALQAQHHNRFNTGQAGPQIRMPFHTPTVKFRRQQGWRADQPDLGTQGCQGQDIGPRHPAMQDVAHNGNGFSANVAEMFTHGHDIQEGLGRVLVGAVTGVYHRTLIQPGQQVGRAGGRMTQHQGCRTHGAQVAGRIHQGFAFVHAAGGGGDIDRIRGQAFGRNLKGGARPGAGLVEQVDNGLSP